MRTVSNLRNKQDTHLVAGRVNQDHFTEGTGYERINRVSGKDNSTGAAGREAGGAILKIAGGCRRKRPYETHIERGKRLKTQVLYRRPVKKHLNF